MKRLLAALLLTSLASGAMAEASTHSPQKKARSTPRRMPSVSYIYSWHRCGPCKKLAGFIAAKVPVKVDTLATRPIGVLDFPTVVYSDGSKDFGERVYAGSAGLGKSVLVIEWVGE